MQILITIILILLLLILLSIIIIFALFSFDLFFELPYVATRVEKIPTILNLAQIKKGERVVDLGSGDGRLLIASAKKGAIATGYELNPVLVVITKIKTLLWRFPNQIIVRRKNLWSANLKNADVIFVYGRKKTMKRFEDFVYKSAKKGARIIVNSDKTVSFPTKKPNKLKNGIFLYVV